MSTTRHLINSTRRRQAREARTPDPVGVQAAPAEPSGRAAAPASPRRSVTPTRPRGSSGTATLPRPGESAGTTSRTRPGSRSVVLVVLCLLTLLLGGFAGWAHARAHGLRDDPALRNTALTDAARTSEIKGQTAKAVAALFSYDHADPGGFEKAEKTLLTGKAVAQHKALLADVRAAADKQKAVITTTVTDSAVERIDGDRARVLVYADQSSVATAGKKAAATGGDDPAAADDGTYAGAMLAVDLLRRDGHWLVSGIDTFGR